MQEEATGRGLEKTTEAVVGHDLPAVLRYLWNQVSRSQAHSHASTKVRVVCFLLEWNNFKCSCPATDLCSILFKNALARDFSRAHNFKAFCNSFLAVGSLRGRDAAEVTVELEFLESPLFSLLPSIVSILSFSSYCSCSGGEPGTPRVCMCTSVGCARLNSHPVSSNTHLPGTKLFRSHT